MPLLKKLAIIFGKAGCGLKGQPELAEKETELLNLRRDRSIPALCPFCRRPVPRPEELADGLWYDFDGGVCPTCGAHYAHDPTARNGGAVLLQAMVQACRGDWDLALELTPGVDYDDQVVTNYDGQHHRVADKAFGSLYFVRLKPEALKRVEKT